MLFSTLLLSINSVYRKDDPRQVPSQTNAAVVSVSRAPVQKTQDKEANNPLGNSPVEQIINNSPEFIS